MRLPLTRRCLYNWDATVTWPPRHFHSEYVSVSGRFAAQRSSIFLWHPLYMRWIECRTGIRQLKISLNQRNVRCDLSRLAAADLLRSPLQLCSLSAPLHAPLKRFLETGMSDVRSPLCSRYVSRSAHTLCFHSTHEVARVLQWRCSCNQRINSYYTPLRRSCGTSVTWSTVRDQIGLDNILTTTTCRWYAHDRSSWNSGEARISVWVGINIA